MKLKLALLSGLVMMASSAMAADKYKLDTEGAHSYVNFKVSHLGYGFVDGRFNEFEGEFSYDSASNVISDVNVVVKTDSVDSNHGERDKHIRSDDFLDVANFGEATFVSTGFAEGKLTGDITIHGVTKSITIPMTKTAEGDDPWGGYRIGLFGTVELTLADFGIKRDLGPSSKVAELEVLIEGIKQ